MKAFLEEYGIAILVVAVIFILILIATPVGDMIKEGLLNLIGNLTGVVNSDSKATQPETATTALKVIESLHI